MIGKLSMNQPTVEKLPGSKVRMTFTVTPEQARPYIDEAARSLSEAKPVAGFRPGKAPYAEVAKQFGEMRVWETALERIVRASYMRAILDNDLDTVGSPEVSVEKLVPGSDMRFTVTAPVAPTVQKMAEYDKERVEYKERGVKDEEVEKAIHDLRMMQRKEVASANPLAKTGVAVIDLEMKKDGVIVEDGSARDYRVYMGEEHYIPGFTDKLLGMKQDEERTFTLPFPKEHFQKHLAGRDVEFTARAKQVYTLELPEADDAFAASLGQENMEALRNVIRTNLGLEERARAMDKAEIELLEKLVDETSFSEIPEILVNEEVRKMLNELERSVRERGMKIEDYLTSIKKTMDNLRLEFVPQAMRRIRAATLIKEVAKREAIGVTDAEADAEIDRILQGVPGDDKDTRERVASPEYREYVAIVMRNRKTLDVLKKKGIKNYPDPQADHDHACGPDCGHVDSE
jgi:trigger factor